MQFLSDVYLRCPDCNGRRYREEILDIRREGADGRRCNIAEVLELTVTQARAFFADAPEVAARLAPLADVGLEYLKLGQPVPTLSGGEAQRLKLAGHLAEAGSVLSSTTHRGKLFLFDEPTTGLHFEDVAQLLRAFRKLLVAGHSLLVIEHNLDVIRAADWIIDLGPEGGERGGRAGVRRHAGAGARAGALLHRPGAARLRGGAGAARGARRRRAQPRAALRAASNGHDSSAVVIHKAREHNLKNIDVEIPRDRFTVITGVSGSGKSTLAFDILFNEGQRRYLESLNAYARQFVQPAARPDVDAIFGIPPTVAIEQRTSRGGRKSTVATLTEIYHFLRLLYVKLGTQYCPDCDVAIEPQSPASIAARLLREYRGRRSRCSRRWSWRARATTPIWPAGRRRRAFARCASTARCCRPRPGRACRASGSTPSSCRSPKSTSASGARARCARHSRAHWISAKGCVHVLPMRAPRGRRCFPRAAPALPAAGVSPSSTRGCSRSTPAMAGARAATGPAWRCRALTRSKAARSYGGTSGTRASRRRATPAKVSASTPSRSTCAFASARSPPSPASPSAPARSFSRRLRLGTREREIARDLLAEVRARLKFLERVGLGYLQLDRCCAHALGRRSATHPPRRAARLEPAGRVLRAR